MQIATEQHQSASVARGPGRMLVAILLLAAALRLAGLTTVPPGLNQDEAANAWNAWCLLKSGHDQHGAAWPVFYFRELGGNRSTLYMYLVMICQAVLGLGSLTARLPNALGGIAAVAMLYYIASRLFDRTIGLWAAALLAVQPWNLYQSRWGNEGGFAGTLALVPLAALLWARFPPRRPENRSVGPPSPTTSESTKQTVGLGGPTLRQTPGSTLRTPTAGRSFLAGLLIGLDCYGYAATRIFIPAFLMSLTVALAPAWWRLVRSAPGRKATVALLVGVMIPFGPLAWMHVRYADEINIRARHLWAWGRDDPLSRKLEKAAERFAHHYNSTFLFQVGDEAIEIWPNGVGVLPWASLPLILLGIAVLVRPVGPPESRTATLVWLLLYPAGDILTFHYTANAMRAAPGMGIAAMLTALGMVACWRLLAQRHTRTLRLVAAVAVGFFFVVQTVSFIRYYFVGFPLEKSTRITFHADLVEACEWLRPRRSAFQAIGFTTREFNQPYIVATTVLQTPPQRWHGEPRIFDMTGDWDTYHRVGDLYFLYHQSPDEWLASLRGEGVRGPAALVVRPGETTAGRLIHSIRDPENNPRLEIRAVD